MRRNATIISLALAIASCGGGDSGGGSGSVPTPTPTPAPMPSPSASPTPTAFDPALARLRSAAASGAPLARSAEAVDVAVSATTSLADGVVIGNSDSRLRWLGGRSRIGVNFPFSLARIGQSTQNGDPAVLNGGGLPEYAFAINVGVRFVLPAGQRVVELHLLDGGDNAPLDILVDGRAVLAAPVPLALPGNQGEKFVRVTLPPSSASRTVELDFGWKPLIGLKLPSGETLQATGDTGLTRVVFIGDSITQGEVARHSSYSWAMQAAFRLGVTDPVVSGVGGSGYLQRFPAATGYNFNDRLNDAVQAFDGVAPDAVIVAGGINDCTFEKNPASQVGAAARSYFTALRNALPATPIFVVGPWTDWNNPGVDKYEAALGPCRNAIFGAAQGIAGTYTIDTSSWITLENRDTIFAGQTYGPHPVDAGHAYYGQRVADAIRAILGK